MEPTASLENCVMEKRSKSAMEKCTETSVVKGYVGE